MNTFVQTDDQNNGVDKFVQTDDQNNEYQDGNKKETVREDIDEKKEEEKELLKQQEEGKTIIEWDDF